MSYTSTKPSSAPKGGSSQGSKMFLTILAAALLVLVAGAVIYKTLRGDADAAEGRAVAVSSQQAVTRLYQDNAKMPAQARAAAEAAAAAHGTPPHPQSAPGH